MAWVRLDDGFFTNPKVLGVSQAAKLYHLAALTYCARELTDGFVPLAASALIAGMIGVRKPDPLADELLRSGLWEITDGGFRIHDYLEYQPSREQVLKDRADARERMANNRRRSPEVPPNNPRTAREVHLPPSPTPSPGSKEPPTASGGSAPAGVVTEKKHRPKKATADEIENLVAEFTPEFGGGEPVVRSEIARALNHTSSAKWIDQRRGLHDWLRRDVDQYEFGRAPTPIHSSRNGSGKPLSAATQRYLAAEGMATA